MDEFEVGTTVLVDDGGGYGPGWGTVIKRLGCGWYQVEFGNGHRSNYRADMMVDEETYFALAAYAAEHW